GSMARHRNQFVCQACGTASHRWQGRCEGCGEWNTMAEEAEGGGIGGPSPLKKGRVVALEKLTGTSEEAPRHKTGIGEFDRVLGGGLVPGSALLIGGDPGIGKSTLLLQAFAAVSQKGLTCLYVSGEESPRQIKMRAERLGIEAPNLLVLSETSLERILDHVKKIKPGLLVIDSVQTIFSSAIPSAPGSIAQVREA